MVKWLLSKLKDGRAHFAAEDFGRSYDQTAGALLRGDDTTTSLLNRVEVDARGCITPAGEGTLAAVDDFCALMARREA